jgi:hypothetical protein
LLYLQVRSPYTTPGYYCDPAATAALYGPDGWLRTGDLGWMDAEGCVWLTGRAKELLKVGNGLGGAAERVSLGVSPMLKRDRAYMCRCFFALAQCFCFLPAAGARPPGVAC